jgi:hypothetical protein
MSHFAKVCDGVVLNVIVAEPEFFEEFVDTIPGDWIQCSYNTRGGIHYQPNSNEPSEDQSKALRKNFPSKGWTYNHILDAFISPKPYASWELNEETCLWEAPVARPVVTGKDFRWDETTTSWIEYTIGV